MVPSDLQFFDVKDFHRPELMDESFVRWLDQVRGVADVPFVLTDDGRLDTDPNPTGSAGKHSLHRRGRAVDVRSRTWSAVEKWKVVDAVMALAHLAPGKVELELVYSTTDQHFHIGVDETATEHRLLEALE